MTTIYSVALLSAVLLNSLPAYAGTLLDTVLKNDLNKAHILLGQGSVDVKAKDSKGRTALIYAVRTGSTTLKDQFVKTTLIHVANGGYLEISQLHFACN